MACSAACRSAGFISALGNLYDCKVHGSHLCDRNCRSRSWCSATCATVCSISGRAFFLAPSVGSCRKRSASDFPPIAAEDAGFRKSAAVAQSWSARAGEAAFLRDQTVQAELAACWTPTVTTPHAVAQQWANCVDME